MPSLPDCLGGGGILLSWIHPLELVASARAQLWQLSREGLLPDKAARREEETRARILTLWQERWDTNSGKAAWTKALLPNVRKWLESDGYRWLSFHVIQALTGHGCFRSYLAATPYCPWCAVVMDDPPPLYLSVISSSRREPASTGCWGDRLSKLTWSGSYAKTTRLGSSFTPPCRPSCSGRDKTIGRS